MESPKKRHRTHGNGIRDGLGNDDDAVGPQFLDDICTQDHADSLMRLSTSLSKPERLEVLRGAALAQVHNSLSCVQNLILHAHYILNIIHDPPDPQFVADAVALIHILEAIEYQRRSAQLPKRAKKKAAIAVERSFEAAVLLIKRRIVVGAVEWMRPFSFEQHCDLVHTLFGQQPHTPAAPIPTAPTSIPPTQLEERPPHDDDPDLADLRTTGSFLRPFRFELTHFKTEPIAQLLIGLLKDLRMQIGCDGDKQIEAIRCYPPFVQFANALTWDKAEAQVTDYLGRVM
ncbi:uncharacterized protein BJ171DRAFT_99529 [Polychytrium aggregatum]|uniref:uncharacterized protein n=1 Tax=Polychytrium aggregatum TaxID=110093 RepID=UPI0022FF3854|nr:uncharacterized protein BJ171DRAFT_99529 [Polychytrium aggregatum]KAI9204670.1 hypothetical protein BJ171DRAFT_99529 [Polychytrium aggregatum]